MPQRKTYDKILDREFAIDSASAHFSKLGYGVNPIVYRDFIKTSLALTFLKAADIDAQMKIDRQMNWCVIGTKTYDDNQKIRNGVSNLYQCLTQELNG